MGANAGGERACKNSRFDRLDPIGFLGPELGEPAPAAEFEFEQIARLATLGLATAGIAHDLGNLLQIVASAVRLIGRDVVVSKCPKFADLTEAALTAVDRAAALSHQILDLSKPVQTPSEIAYPGSVAASLSQVISLWVGPAIKVRIAVNDPVPAVACSPRELENALLNLVVNARDAMPDGGDLTLSVHGEGSDDAGCEAGPATAVFCVRDTGYGMSPETAQRVFAPFFTTKPSGRGAGLGLALVNDFARRAGGSAEVMSALGVGTDVILRLPGCRANTEG